MEIDLRIRTEWGGEDYETIELPNVPRVGDFVSAKSGLYEVRKVIWYSDGVALRVDNAP